MRQVVLVRKAEKDLNKIEQKHKPRIIAALFELRNPSFKGKPLKGKLKDCYSLRVWPYRIIYKIYHKRVVIIRIGHR
jgi:addiction module RelE/StbE family toxin